MLPVSSYPPSPVVSCSSFWLLYLEGQRGERGRKKKDHIFSSKVLFGQTVWRTKLGRRWGQFPWLQSWTESLWPLPHHPTHLTILPLWLSSWFLSIAMIALLLEKVTIMVFKYAHVLFRFFFKKTCFLVKVYLVMYVWQTNTECQYVNRNKETFQWLGWCIGIWSTLGAWRRFLLWTLGQYVYTVQFTQKSTARSHSREYWGQHTSPTDSPTFMHLWF